jgi:hypothetical protein
MRHLPALAATLVILAATTPATRGAPAPALALAPVVGRESPNLVINGGAEEVENGQLANWDMATATRDAALKLGRDTHDAKAGKASFFIENRHHDDKPVANNWRQELRTPPAAMIGKTLQISAAIKTAGAADGANVCLQCWDAGYKTMLGFASTRVVKGDADWTAVQSTRIVVPKGTHAIVVRAALGNMGKAWFDDIVVRELPPATRPTTGGADLADAELLARVKGKVLEVVPVDRDQMVLCYLPEWSHGRVDNLAVANNDGGVRTLIAWPAIATKHRADDCRILLALYARETVQHGQPPGAISVYEILDDWDEQTSWTKQPRTTDKPAAEFPFENSKGWHVFDITKLAASQRPADKPSHGVMLRFATEDRTADTWSGYAFVSREGDGEWAGKQPVILVMKPTTTTTPAPTTP